MGVYSVQFTINKAIIFIKHIFKLLFGVHIFVFLVIKLNLWVLPAVSGGYGSCNSTRNVCVALETLNLVLSTFYNFLESTLREALCRNSVWWELWTYNLTNSTQHVYEWIIAGDFVHLFIFQKSFVALHVFTLLQGATEWRT